MIANIIISFPFLFLFSSVKTVELNIVSELSLEPIAFATISTTNEIIIGQTDSLGIYYFEDKPPSFIVVSAIGFLTQKVYILEMTPIIIKLKKDIYPLETISIYGAPPNKGGPPKNNTMNGRRKVDYVKMDLKECITFKSLPDTGQLKDITFYIKRTQKFRQKKEVKMRLVIYNLNKQGLPDKKIAPDIFFIPKRSSMKIYINVSEYDILVPQEGFAISIEWLAGENYKLEKDGVYRLKYTQLSEIQKPYYGSYLMIGQRWLSTELYSIHHFVPFVKYNIEP